MRTATCVMLAGLAGCSFTHGAASDDAHQMIDAALGDGSGGGSGDGSGSGSGSGDGGGGSDCEVFASLGVNVCAKTAPTGAIDISGTLTLDTGTGVTTPASAISCAMVAGGATPDVCLLVGTTITLDPLSTLYVKGGKPLVLLATQSIDIEGTLNVSSQVATSPGPGMPSSSCAYGAMPTTRSGGQGGSFGTVGADGGDADNGGAGGTHGAGFTPTALVRGCDGKDGEGSAGSHGAGGGVVLIAAPALTIGTASAINASGASGKGGTGNGAGGKGGGGAGAGGLIVLDAATISMPLISLVGGSIYANGGAGGGGGGNMTGGNGTDSSGPTSGAGGGTANRESGAGGEGAFIGTAARDGSDATGSNDGGGGGGGGAGWILVHSQTSLTGNAGVSPAPTSVP